MGGLFRGGVELPEVFCGIVLELGLTIVAAEFDLLSLVVDDGGFAHGAEFLAGDDADIERVGSGGGDFFGGRGGGVGSGCVLVAGEEGEG